jgi:hypothetical protein
MCAMLLEFRAGMKRRKMKTAALGAALWFDEVV